jgi:thiamine-monophosphate kinase
MNEFDFIRQLREQVRSRETSSRVLAGIGDDAAVIRQSFGRDSVITADLLIESIDFHRSSTPARMLGHKALAVSLSDIAAMGARPFYSLVSLGLPEDVWGSDFKENFYEGYLALADKFGVTLAGGDISRSEERVVVDSIVCGEVSNGAAVMRSGARPGDQIYVTGTLGGAAAGLKLIELGARVGSAPAQATASETTDDEAIQSLLLRQLRPSPRVGWGIILGTEKLASAMIDISDGLSSDVNHLCAESGVGAVIDSASIPIDPNVTRLCGRRALDPLALALHGGEDFELLFTVSPENVERLPKRVDGIAHSLIGEITDKPGVVRIREKNREWELDAGGFQHFGNQRPFRLPSLIAKGMETTPSNPKAPKRTRSQTLKLRYCSSVTCELALV